MTAVSVLRALVVGPPEVCGDLADAVRRAGWEAVGSDGFGHARFLMDMTLFEAVVVAAFASADFLDGLAWLAARGAVPPVLVAPLADEVILPAVRRGALWLPAEALRCCPALLGAMLDQAVALGRQRQADGLALPGSEAHVDRLLNMLWEVAPLAGPRWFTQRHMLERLDEEVARTRRGGGPLAVVVGELAIPSDLPRSEADRLAGWMAGAVALGKRRSDVAGHYGQRGFLMVLPQTTQEQALGACRRLREVLARLPGAPPGVQPCLALVQMAGEEASVPGLLRRAEERLDRARGTGEVIAEEAG
jgi:hypothetical protein